MIVALYSQIIANVSLNGLVNTYFELQSFVKQGCPLALYLYLLVREIFGSMLDNFNRRFEGFTLLDDTIITT